MGWQNLFDASACTVSVTNNGTTLWAGQLTKGQSSPIFAGTGGDTELMQVVVDGAGMVTLAWQPGATHFADNYSVTVNPDQPRVLLPGCRASGISAYVRATLTTPAAADVKLPATGVPLSYSGSPPATLALTPNPADLSALPGAVGVAVYQGTTGAIVLTGAMGNGRSGVVASGAYIATGGAGSKTFSVVAGTFPPGLTLHADGTWSGTRTTTGTYSFTIRATDAFGSFANLPDTSTTTAAWAWSFVQQAPLATQAARLAPAYYDPVTNLTIATDDATGGVYLSSDGGATWTAIATGLNGAASVYNAGASNGALMAFSATTGGGWKRSTDLGVTWNNVLIGGSTAPPVDNLISSPACMFVYGNLAGVAKFSTDGGATWTDCTSTPPGFNVGDSIFAFQGLYLSAWTTWIAPGQGAIYEASGTTPAVWTVPLTGIGRVGFVAYSPTLDMAVITSSDGIYYRTRTGAWALGPSSPVNCAHGVCWCPPLGQFIAYVSTNIMYSSNDGIHWTGQTSTGLANAGYMTWSPPANEILVTPGVSPFIPYLSNI